MANQVLQEGSIVRLKSGTQGWIKGQIVEYFDVIPSVGGVIYTGPGYKVHILEGKHKGETIKVPANYVESYIGPAQTKKEPLYPHVPKSRQPLFPHVPGGQQPGTKLPATEKLYQRGADGYPIGADKIMRDAWGPIPNPDQPFWSRTGFVKPAKIYGWQWAPDYHSWRAYVRFPDGTETWTSPREQTGGSLELLASTEGDPLRKFCCRQCGECAPKEMLEEGRFPDRIAWLRHHYKEKHPGMWGKVQAAAIPTQPKLTRDDVEVIIHGEEDIGFTVTVIDKKSGNTVAEFGEARSSVYAEDILDELEHLGILLPKRVSAEKLPQTIAGGDLIPPQYRHLTGWVSEPLPREAE